MTNPVERQTQENTPESLGEKGSKGQVGEKGMNGIQDLQSYVQARNDWEQDALKKLGLSK